MDAIDVAVACETDSGIIVGVNVREIGGVADACGRTIVAVGKIGTGTVAQEVRIKIMRKFDVHFI